MTAPIALQLYTLRQAAAERGYEAVVRQVAEMGYAGVEPVGFPGSEGSLSVPDPNTFGGPVLLRVAGEGEWREIPDTHSAEVGRGIGVAALAYALTDLGGTRRHRASGELAYHVLDLMHGFHDASRQDRHIYVESSCERPAALPVGLEAGTLD